MIAAAAHRFGWRGLALGSVLGATGVAVLAALAALQAATCRIARHWLDRISVLPPLGFGLQRAYEITAGLRGRDGADVHPRGQAFTCPSTPAGSVRASGIGSGGAGQPRGLARRVPAQKDGDRDRRKRIGARRPRPPGLLLRDGAHRPTHAARRAGRNRGGDGHRSRRLSIPARLHWGGLTGRPAGRNPCRGRSDRGRRSARQILRSRSGSGSCRARLRPARRRPAERAAAVRERGRPSCTASSSATRVFPGPCGRNRGTSRSAHPTGKPRCRGRPSSC